MATALFLCGAAAVSVALWWLHPSAGLGFAGAVLIVIALAVSKLNDHKSR